MDTLSRRRFLQLTSGAAIGAAAPILSIDSIAAAARIRPLPLGTPIFVLITLYGGNDGLNTVIPYKDATYFQSRPEISYKESELLPLGEDLALNGSMSGIKTLWDLKKVAIIRGVGYPQPDRSHFSSMAIWQSASPVSHVSSGWLGRWLDRQGSDPMLAISLGSVLPPLLAGTKQSGSALPLGGLVVPTGKLALDCQRISAASGGDSTSRLARDGPVGRGRAPGGGSVVLSPLRAAVAGGGPGIPVRRTYPRPDPVRAAASAAPDGVRRDAPLRCSFLPGESVGYGERADGWRARAVQPPVLCGRRRAADCLAAAVALRGLRGFREKPGGALPLPGRGGHPGQPQQAAQGHPPRLGRVARRRAGLRFPRGRHLAHRPADGAARRVRDHRPALQGSGRAGRDRRPMGLGLFLCRQPLPLEIAAPDADPRVRRVRPGHPERAR